MLRLLVLLYIIFEQLKKVITSKIFDRFWLHTHTHLNLQLIQCFIVIALVTFLPKITRRESKTDLDSFLDAIYYIKDTSSCLIHVTEGELRCRGSYIALSYDAYLPFWIRWPIKTLNQNYFRSIYQKHFRKKFVIKIKLSL